MWTKSQSDCLFKIFLLFQLVCNNGRTLNSSSFYLNKKIYRLILMEIGHRLSTWLHRDFGKI
jgi:hypothetical protein